eukprot:30911-Pelagococcus_subviridis.AAC.11
MDLVSLGSVFRLEGTEIQKDKLYGPFFFARDSTRRDGRVRRGYSLAADHLVDVVLAREHEERGLDDAAAETEHEVQRGLLLDVVIRERAAVLELLAREDQTLLVGGDPLLVLDLRLDVVDGVRGLHLQGDGLTRDCGVEKEGEVVSAPSTERRGRRWTGGDRAAGTMDAAAMRWEGDARAQKRGVFLAIAPEGHPSTRRSSRRER